VSQRDQLDLLGLAALERDALNDLLQACGESRKALLAPPAHLDPVARTYCPICLGDYRIAEGTCVDCRVALVRYGD